MKAILNVSSFHDAHRRLDWQTFICSLNFLLSIIGYPLAMALLVPLSGGIEAGDNIYFTYPYRAIQLIIAIVALFSVRRRSFPTPSWKILLVCLFWIFYFTRAFWDLMIDPPYGSTFSGGFSRGQEWYYSCYILIDFLPLLAVMKGHDCIDFQRTLKWLLVLGGIGLAFSLKSMHHQLAESWTGELSRVSATRMLHTQALGNFGCYMAIASFWFFFNSHKILWKIFSVGIGLLAIYMMIKAASRGPAFGFAVVVCTWFSLRNKSVVFALFAGILGISVLFLFHEQLLSVIGEISPEMGNRMRLFLDEGNTSGRDVLWATYWAECLRNPLFGFQLDRFYYPHNMFIDGFMMFGLIAGWIVTILILTACISIVKALKVHVPDSWWILFLLGQLSQSFTQSGFSAVAIQAPLLLLFIYEAQRRNVFLSPMAVNSPFKHELKSSSPL